MWHRHIVNWLKLHNDENDVIFEFYSIQMKSDIWMRLLRKMLKQTRVKSILFDICINVVSIQNGFSREERGASNANANTNVDIICKALNSFI